ncbi:MAG: hypothetical protein F4100_07395 [Rhodothermaceae bacterium]|nr:hypothetical protein [Rhodothermaceae bacterium]MYE62001.1 hypothetical protein [Rhodothermaceae bacterium]MYJ20550.1 hypothetical protein [Rhodothermaceae bacterium]
MQELLLELSREDYAYLIQIIQGPFDRCTSMKRHLEEIDSPDHHAALCEELEKKIRYLGSSDLAYQVRRVVGKEPGADFRYIIRDTARFLKIPVADRGTERGLLIRMAQEYAVDVFSKYTQAEQLQILESLGIERKRAVAFLKKAGGIFAAPVLLQAFGTLVVQGLIKTVLFGWTVRLIGVKLATSLFAFLFARVPWWAHTIIPGAWVISIGLTTLDLQGPARRKTVPILLYLGLSCIRLDAEKDQRSVDANESS